MAQHPARDPAPRPPPPGPARRRQIVHATKLPLTGWSLAMWPVATAKDGISPVELGRRLGIERTNARALRRKVARVTAEREGRKRLDGRVGMDDACRGGRRPGRRGRGAAGKRPFVAAGPTSDGRRPRETRPPPVKGFREKEVRKPVAEHLASTGRLVTDGPGCRTAAAEAGLEHTAVATGGGRRAAGWSPFRRVDATLGNVEAAVAGTCRRVGPERAGRHLASFARRHDRRFPLESLIPRLVHGAVRTAPLPYAKLVAG